MADEAKKRAGIYVASALVWKEPTVWVFTEVRYGPDEQNAQDAAAGTALRTKPKKDGYTGHTLIGFQRIDDDLIRQAARALEAEHGVSPVPIDDQIGRLSVVPEKDKS